MTSKIENSIEIDEAGLDAAKGGIGLLLPAVQKVRDPAARAPGYTGQTPINQGVLTAK